MGWEGSSGVRRGPCLGDGRRPDADVDWDEGGERWYMLSKIISKWRLVAAAQSRNTDHQSEQGANSVTDRSALGLRMWAEKRRRGRGGAESGIKQTLNTRRFQIDPTFHFPSIFLPPRHGNLMDVLIRCRNRSLIGPEHCLPVRFVVMFTVSENSGAHYDRL
jgi:hypothetical protein